jgi:hypothetical protein
MRVFLKVLVAGCLSGIASLGAHSASAGNFTWTAPNSCPNEQDVRAQVERGLGVRFAAVPEVTFEATARNTQRGFELALEARKGEAVHVRRVHASTCEELISVLVAAMSLALESLSPPSAESNDDKSVASTPEPEPSEPHAAPAPQKRDQQSANPSTKHEYSAFVELGALVDVGTMPDPTYGGTLAGGAGLDVWKLRAYGLVIPRQRSNLRGTAEGSFDLVAAGLGFCGSPLRQRLELRGCVSGEFGRLRGEGDNVRNARVASALWLAAIPELWVLVRPSARGWSLFAHVDVPVALYRKSFVLTELGDVHTPALPALRLAAGLELELL